MRIGAIAAGWLTDLGLSLLFFGIVAAIVGGDGSPPEDVTRRMNSSLELMLSMLLVGLAFTGIGGYVAAAIARQQHLRHAAAVGLLSLGVSVSAAVGAPMAQPPWLTVIGLVLAVPFALFGGWYRAQTERP